MWIIPQGEKNIIVLGDSFAVDAYNAFSTAYPEMNFIFLGSNGCAPFDEGGKGKEKCPENNRVRNQMLAGLGNVKDVILTLSIMPDDDHRRAALPSYIMSLGEAGHRVIVLGASTRYKRPMPEIYVRLARNGNAFPDLSNFRDESPYDFDPVLKQATLAAGGLFIDRVPFFCPAGVCRDYTLARDALLFQDGRHFTLQTAVEFGQYVRQTYPDLFATP